MFLSQLQFVVKIEQNNEYTLRMMTILKVIIQQTLKMNDSYMVQEAP